MLKEIIPFVVLCARLLLQRNAEAEGLEARGSAIIGRFESLNVQVIIIRSIMQNALYEVQMVLLS